MMKLKICDHTSVGIIVWKEGKLLLIERKNFPFGFAVPAGHATNIGSYEEAAVVELKEEVGLTATSLQLLLEGRKENPCRQVGGSWHYWKVYRAEVEGELIGSERETKRIGWYPHDELEKLGEKTQMYLDKKISEENWERSPGLEPVWYEFLTELKII